MSIQEHYEETERLPDESEQEYADRLAALAEQQAEATPEPAADSREDLISQIRELHEEVKAEHHLDIEIPGYKNLLWARFRPYEVAKMEPRIKQIQKQSRRGPALFSSACDTLIDACEQLMLLPAKFGGGTEEADIGLDGCNLIPIDDDIPVQFDERLERMFNLDNPSHTAKGVIRSLFATEQGVLAMHVRVQQWLADVTLEASEDLVGE